MTDGAILASDPAYLLRTKCLPHEVKELGRTLHDNKRRDCVIAFGDGPRRAWNISLVRFCCHTHFPLFIAVIPLFFDFLAKIGLIK
jgi:hypothetical protein